MTPQRSTPNPSLGHGQATAPTYCASCSGWPAPNYSETGGRLCHRCSWALATVGAGWLECPRCRGPITVQPGRPTDDRAGPDDLTLTELAACLNPECGWTS